MQKWLAIMLALSFGLSGCANNDDSSADCAATDSCADEHGEHGENGEHTAVGGDGHDGMEGGNMTNGTVPNTAPMVNLTFPAETAIAGQPATFVINITDAEGDELYWSFDADGDGIEDLNGTEDGHAIWTFDTDGVFTITVNVTDGQATNMTSLEVIVEAPAATSDPNAPEDRGWYIFDPVSKVCQVKAFVDVGGAGLIYQSALSGGDWYLSEANGMAGLQIEDNHPVGGGLFGVDVPDCEDGDQVVV